ncbi:unnamed protein product [Brachionus calyciflorus]|uniref:Uncharacterized protein n=1 Tax=Brachionus calyciflorus TaxID=104777 RepID=A0A813Q778_9BILA|nr:unnamed protein product [Brachionus calyciflorus]
MKLNLIISFGLVLFQKIISFAIHGSFCDNCDFGHYDIDFAQNMQFEDCWISCLNNINCTHFAYSKVEKFCWLKNKVNVSFSFFYDHSLNMCGIIDRSTICSPTEDFTPNPNNCILYYRCFARFLQVLGCQKGMYFDPFLKACTINSTCSYACKNEKELVGIINNNTNSNEFYNCITQKIETCKWNGRFDIIKKECTNFVTSKVYKMQYASGDYGLIGSANFNFKLLCLVWCLKDSNCKMVLFIDKYLCHKFELAKDNFQLKSSFGYFQQ